ncbi:MAG: glucokinase [Alphaproteobacteria bacterium]|nr:glucokinase [Alphaproteobacteria bacterium]
MLLGDIGGTHARFQLCEQGRLLGRTIDRTCTEFSGIEAVIADVLPILEQKPRSLLLAVAGPVDGDAVRLTNLGWRFSCSELKQETGLESCHIINDMAATAWCLPTLGAADRLQIGGGSFCVGATMAVIGPGTGLGVAALVPTPQGWTAVEGEGGHANLAAQGDFDSALLDHLRRERGHVSYEAVLSGPGLVRLYRAVRAVTGVGSDDEHLSPEDITRMAAAGTEPVAQRVLTTFCRLLGSFSGDLALIYGARGGIYIAGGIVPLLGQLFDHDEFRQHFEAKGRLSHFVASIATCVIVKPLPALTGLAHLAGSGTYAR